jgi:hypothetical protein
MSILLSAFLLFSLLLGDTFLLQGPPILKLMRMGICQSPARGSLIFLVKSAGFAECKGSRLRQFRVTKLACALAS